MFPLKGSKTYRIPRSRRMRSKVDMLFVLTTATTITNKLRKTITIPYLKIGEKKYEVARSAVKAARKTIVFSVNSQMCSVARRATMMIRAKLVRVANNNMVGNIHTKNARRPVIASISEQISK